MSWSLGPQICSLTPEAVVVSWKSKVDQVCRIKTGTGLDRWDCKGFDYRGRKERNTDKNTCIQTRDGLLKSSDLYLDYTLLSMQPFFSDSTCSQASIQDEVSVAPWRGRHFVRVFVSHKSKIKKQHYKQFIRSKKQAAFEECTLFKGDKLRRTS